MRGCAVLCLLEGGWSGVPDAPGPLCRWRWEGRRRGRRLGWRFHRGDHCHRRLCCWSVWGHQLKDEKKKKQIKREKQRGSKKNMQMERNWQRTSDTNWWKGWGRREWENERNERGAGETGKMSITLTHKHCSLFRWTSQGHPETLSYT